MNNVIAFHTLYGRSSDGELFEITIEIGTPYKVPDSPDVWACPVSLRPLYMHLDAYGDSSLQALTLGLSLIMSLLQGFMEEGGTLYHDQNDDGDATGAGFEFYFGILPG